MFPEDSYLLDFDLSPELRDVSSTAKLFNFKRPVYMTTDVWQDCVELNRSERGKPFDELTVLQRLRHILFMAASALHGRSEDIDFNFRVYRIPNSKAKVESKPEPVDLNLTAHKDEHNMPVITIKFTGLAD